MPTYIKARLLPSTRTKPARVSIVHLNTAERATRPLTHASVREEIEAAFPGCEYLWAEYGWIYFKCAG
ncbi:hypothetical protein BLA39750_02213 [Burkholderia lata]|uniref:Uncharacterized protein n=1 Tax=Burkholderia lata (strain ATCC 17760 / DSM 23089 / LMG 22485 / NCIMB 9086 / R18194 / 383) TaxID=482957 RepID=A0A6P2WDN2_BURL3|nr:hypothetical protein [Burkholderia lata]VWC95790.1 hypothetical protein BLA39750_02213 [Burkholderia lata]